MILFYFPVDLLLFFFSATKKKIGNDVRNNKNVETFLPTTKMSRLSCEETKSLIGPRHNIIIATTHTPNIPAKQQKCRYHPLKKQNCRLAPGHNITTIANKRCVFNYLPLRVTIDPFISYFLTNF